MAYKPKPNEKLVGRRIPESTPLGKELATLRETLKVGQSLDPLTLEKLKIDAMNASLRVSLQDGLERDSRRRAIRKQLEDAIYAIEAQSGRVPDTVGVPKHLIEEARGAMIGSKYDGVKIVVERT